MFAIRFFQVHFKSQFFTQVQIKFWRCNNKPSLTYLVPNLKWLKGRFIRFLFSSASQTCSQVIVFSKSSLRQQVSQHKVHKWSAGRFCVHQVSDFGFSRALLPMCSHVVQTWLVYAENDRAIKLFITKRWKVKNDESLTCDVQFSGTNNDTSVGLIKASKVNI